MESALPKYETPLGTYWFEGENILCYKANSKPRTIENIKVNFSIIDLITSGRKVSLLADLGETAPLTREAREYIIAEIQKKYKAVALVPRSPLGQVIAKTFLLMKEPLFPSRMFEDEREAMRWLQRLI